MSGPFPDAHAPQLPSADVCRFLPQLATELATVQTTQNEEVEQKQNHLLQLQEEAKKGNERLEGVVARVCAANRAITVARDESSRAGLRCRELGESLARLAGEREEMRTQLEAVGRERERGERQKEEYVAKMAALRRRVSQAEEDTSAYQELARLLAKKQQMEQKRAGYLHGEGLEILSGERKRRVQESIIAVETACALVDEEASEIKGRKREGEREVQRWKREVEVGRRRQQAQVTRLHRQLHEAQSRRRQWARQVSSLHTTISMLRGKLEDLS
jgi:hypothetical protein